MNVAKAAVVTGAAGGIGIALCKALAKENYAIWAIDINGQGLDALKDAFSKTGLEIHTRIADVTDENVMRDVITQIESTSHLISVWINNAGMSGIGHFDEASTNSLRQMVDVGFTSVMVNTRLVLEKMELRGEGVIVNMASVAGHVAAPYLSAYSGTKHAIVGFTRALEGELKLKSSGVRTLLVSPGFVDTQMVVNASKFSFPEWLHFCLASPDAIAQAVINGIKTQRREIFPSWNGKLIRALDKFVPGLSRRGSKLLVSKSLKDYLLNRFSV